MESKEYMETTAGQQPDNRKEPRHSTGSNTNQEAEFKMYTLKVENLKLRLMITTAIHALRSYEYGNASPELAKEVAAQIESDLK